MHSVWDKLSSQTLCRWTVKFCWILVIVAVERCSVLEWMDILDSWIIWSLFWNITPQKIVRIDLRLMKLMAMIICSCRTHSVSLMVYSSWYRRGMLKNTIAGVNKRLFMVMTTAGNGGIHSLAYSYEYQKWQYRLIIQFSLGSAG